MMFTHILVPTDFSEPSDAALEYARFLAAKFGSTLHLLHVVEVPIMVGSEIYIAESPDVEAALVEQARKRLAERVLPADRGRFNATSEVVTGATAPAIVEYATQQHIGLIVMGTHGRSGMAHLLMGSVAEKVVRSAPCPVMTVRTRSVPAEVAVAAGATTVAPA
jgi:nucleotide-binding universal stress UspA family protein